MNKTLEGRAEWIAPTTDIWKTLPQCLFIPLYCVPAWYAGLAFINHLIGA